jgi:gluconolactonase
MLERTRSRGAATVLALGFVVACSTSSDGNSSSAGPTAASDATGGSSPATGSGGTAPEPGSSGQPEAGATSGSGGASPAVDAATTPASDAGSTGSADSGAAQDAGDAATPTPRPTLAQRVCPSGPFGDPLPSNRTATLVQGGYVFLEGPVWLETQGVLLFSDMDFGASGANGPPARIRRLTPPSALDVLVEQGNTNGLALDGDGAVIGCNHALQTLVRHHPTTGAPTSLAITYDGGKRFNSPNDVTVRSDGTIYFTDPDWQLGPRTSETGFTGVFRVPPGSTDALLVTDQLDKPNGITLALDESTLYVSSAASDLLAYPLSTDGTAGSPRVFASPGGSDGMGIDCAGNLYVTAGGQVRVYSPAGSQLGSISVAEGPSNVAFGGSDHRTLYITARTGLYSIVLNVPGLPY